MGTVLKMFSGRVLFLFLFVVLCTAENCDDFAEGACELSESNIVAHDRNVATPGECQTHCKNNGDCTWFTHFETECYLLNSCGQPEHCEGCVSGPTSPDPDTTTTTTTKATTKPTTTKTTTKPTTTAF